MTMRRWKLCRNKTPLACIILGAVLQFGSLSATAVDSVVRDPNNCQTIEQALPVKATVQPVKPRRLLIFTRNPEYDGHRPAIEQSCQAFMLMGQKTGAFETTVTDDPAVFQRQSLNQYDAVFLNNTIGSTFSHPGLRQNLLEYVTGGGGLMGVHGSVIAFTRNLWPAVEDWPEFGNMIGARGYAHPHANEHIWIKIDDSAHPLIRAFGGQDFELTSEFFRFHEPYSRNLVRILLSMDTAKTDLSHFKSGDACLRQDNDYALAWIRNYGRGRVFYSAIAHHDWIFRDPQMLQFYLDAAQFVLGDLLVPTTPSAKLSPAVLAWEKLDWRLGIEAYTFHKYTFFETIEKTAALGLPYVGGLCSIQHVSSGIPKYFDQNLTDDDLVQIRLKLESAGLRLLTYYVQNFPGDEAGCRKLFDFGRKMGIEIFMGEPRPESLEFLDRFCNEYGIRIAIHNHDKNISPVYWQPEGVLKACEGRSSLIGACPDLGYWMRAGIDLIEGIRILKDRVMVIHMHDLHEQGPNGHDVPWGTGIGNSHKVLEELHRLGIQPVIGIEYAHNWTNSMSEIARCIEFFNNTTLKLASESKTKP